MLDITDDGLTAFMDVDVLDRDFLTFATVAVQDFQQRGIRPREFVRLIKVLAPALEG